MKFAKLAKLKKGDKVWMDAATGVEAAQVPVVVLAGGDRPVVGLRNGSNVVASLRHLHRKPNPLSPAHWAR